MSTLLGGPLNVIPNLGVPFKYRRIHIAAFQCCMPGHAVYLLTRLTAFAMSGRVDMAAYSNGPISSEYDLLAINALSS